MSGRAVAEYVFSVLLTFRSFVGNFVGNFVDATFITFLGGHEEVFDPSLAGVAKWQTHGT